MPPLSIRPIVAACVVVQAACAAGAASSVGRPVAGFVLPDCYGTERSLADYADAEALVVVFLGVECPLAKLYGPRLVDLAEDYADRGVAVIGIDANRQDSLTELAAYAHRYQIGFPLLKDNRAGAADAFGATRTPEAFVLGPERTIRYQGRIDDQYEVGVVRDAPQRRFLREAIDAVLAGGEPVDPITRAVGCVIGRPQQPSADASVTYTE
ncbi:MAG: thioredoxin family protein, partial [Planctomycetota bacterium]